MFYLETERLFLRPFGLSDAKDIQKLANDVDIAKTTLHIPYPYEEGMAELWIRSHKIAFERGHYNFAIVLKKDNHLLGCVSLGTVKEHNRGELGYWIGKDYWGKGYGTEAAARVIQLGFEDLGLNKIWAAAMTKNPASSKVMEKIGMKYEGTFLQHVLKWEQYEDLNYYGMLRSDYDAKKALPLL